MPTYPEYKAGRAEVCAIERITDQGAGQEFFVRLPDGYLLACGWDRVRADLIADCVNVVAKWSGIWPPCGVIESVVRYSFQDEDRALADQPKGEG